jgi:hypothetical protein
MPVRAQMLDVADHRPFELVELAMRLTLKLAEKVIQKQKALTLDRENDRWQREKTGALISP